MIVVWNPTSCDQDPSTEIWTLVETAADAAIDTGDPKHIGPVRTQTFDAAENPLSIAYEYKGVSHGVDEAAALAAWEAWEETP